LTFSANNTPQTISIPLTDDGLNESPETFTLRLTNPVGTTIASGSSGTTITIVDNDGGGSGNPPLIRFTGNSPTIVEGTNQTNATVNIQIGLFDASTTQATTATGTSATVNYSIVGGLASSSNPADFAGTLNGTATIPTGQGTAHISFEIIRDLLGEASEDLTITLSNPTNSSLESGTASTFTLIIVDDDLDPISTDAGYTGDPDSGLSADCKACSYTMVFESYAAVIDGNYIVDGGGLCEKPRLHIQRGDKDGRPPGGGGPPKPPGCQMDSFKQPKYQSRSSGLTPINTTLTVPEIGAAQTYSLQVNLRDSAGNMYQSPEPVYFTKSGMNPTPSGGDQLVLAAQANLATGFYTYESVVTGSGAPSISAYGAVVAVKRDTSEFGAYWWLDELDRLYVHQNALLPGAAGDRGDVVALVRGDGTTAWWKKMGGVWQLETPGSFSTLTEASGEFTLTTKFNEKFVFYGNGYLKKRIDPQGNETNYTYSDSGGTSGRLIEIKDPLGRKTTFSYTGSSPNEKLTTITDFAGREIDATVSDGKLTTLTYPDPEGSDAAPSFTFAYYADELGLLKEVSYNVKNSLDAPSPTGRKLELTYDATGAVSQVTNPGSSSAWTLESIKSKTLKYLVDGDGTQEDPAMLVRASDVVAKQTDETGNATYFKVDALGNTTWIKDALNRETTISRDPDGQVLSVIEPGPDGTPAITSFTYETAKGNLTQVTHPDGSTILYEYDVPPETENPDDPPNAFGIPTLITDELGRKTRIDINATTGVINEVRRIVGCQDNLDTPQDCPDEDDIVTTFTYTTASNVPKGLPLTMTDPLGVRTDYAYYTAVEVAGVLKNAHEAGKLKSITSNAAVNWGTATNAEDQIVEEFVYTNTYGFLESQIDGEKRRTDYAYDELGRLKSVYEPMIDPLSQFNSASAPFGIRTVDNANGTNETTYDDAGIWTPMGSGGYRDTHLQHASGSTPDYATWTFNELSTGKTYAVYGTWVPHDSQSTQAPFTLTGGASPIVVEVDQKNASALPNNDPFGDATPWKLLGHVTLTSSQLVVRLDDTTTGAVDADAVRIGEQPVATITHNEQCKPTSQKDANGNLTKFTYDDAGRLIRETYADPDGQGTPPFTEYFYDAAGRLIKVVDPLGRVSNYEYDALGRLSKSLAPYPDLLGNVIDDGGSGYVESSGWMPGSAGHLGDSRVPMGSGTVTADWKFTGTDHGITQGKTYEVFVKWVEGIEPATNAQYTVYDGGSPSDNPAGTAFALPPTIDQQQPAPVHPILGGNWKSLGTYRVTGNKLTVRLSSSGANGPVSADAVRIVEARDETTIEYDPAGNLWKVTNGLAGVTEHTYDGRHRLVTVTEADPDGTGGSLSSPVTRLAYDAASQLRYVIDPLSRGMGFAYDTIGRLVGESRPISDGNLATPVDNTSSGTSGDDSDSNTTFTLYTPGTSWTSVATGYNGGGNGADHHHITGVAGATATWSIGGLTTGSFYEVLATWVKDTIQGDTTATFEVVNGSTSLGKSVVDQKTDPAGGNAFGDGTLWQSLGVFYVTNATLDVKLLGDTSAKVIADAVRVVKHVKSQYGYDKASNLQTETDELGRVTDYDYDNFYRLSRVIAPDPDDFGSGQNGELHRPAVGYGYNKAHDVLSVTYGPWDTTDFLTNSTRATTYAYDGLARMIKKTLQDPSGVTENPNDDVPIFTYAYDMAGNLTKATDARAAVTDYAYDEWHRLETITWPDPDGSGSAFTHRPQTTYFYDDASQVTKIQDPDPDWFLENTPGAMARPEYVYAYDGAGRLVGETLPDASGATETPNTDKPVYQYFYDRVGNLTRSIDARLGVTQYEYDALGRLKKRVDPDPDGATNVLVSPESEWTYDASGQLLTFTGPDPDKDYSGDGAYVRAVTTFAYDRAGRMVKKTLQDPNLTASDDIPEYAYVYDAVGNLTRVVDALGTGYETDYEYDRLNRLTKRLDPDQDGQGTPDRPTTVYAYDEYGNLKTLTDPAGNDTEWAYDKLERVTGETLVEFSTTRSFKYDTMGNRTEAVDRNGRVTKWDYDLLGRMTEEEWFNSAFDATSDHRIEYAFNPAGWLTSAASNAKADSLVESHYAYGYDPLGRAKRVEAIYDWASGGSADMDVDLDLKFDVHGNREELAVKIGTTNDFKNTYTYDALDRLKVLEQMGQGANAVAKKRVEFDYFGNDQFSAITRKYDNSGWNVSAKSSYGYDQLGRLTSLLHEKANSDDITAYAYQYDKSSRLTQQSIAHGGATETSTFTYDRTHQLIGVASSNDDLDRSFAFDKNGNRTGGGYGSGPAAGTHNRTTTDGTYTYTYDAEGNMTSRASSTERLAFTWDHRNRLARIDTTSLAAREKGRWAFDVQQTTGIYQTTPDGSGSNHPGYLNGNAAITTEFAAPIEGSTASLHVDGNAQAGIDYLWVGDHAELKIAQHDFSFSLWLKTADASAGWQWLVGQGNAYNMGGQGYHLFYQATTKKLAFGMHDGDDIELEGGGTAHGGLAIEYTVPATNGLHDNQWHHIAVTIDHTPGAGDELIKIYLDGNPTPVASAVNTKAGNDIQGTRAFLGGSQEGTTALFNGYLDDLRVFHDVLSAADVAELGRTQEALYQTTRRVEYTYDAFDRRIKKAIDHENDGSYAGANDVVWQYVYDGSDIILAFDKDNALKNRYLHGPAVDQILADEQYGGDSLHDEPATETGNVYWPLADHQGSVRDWVDNTGGVVRHTVFDAFGNIQAGETGTSLKFIYGYTGRERDDESIFDYHRARYYLASTGVWASADPGGFAMGDENLYRYVGNGPTNYTDPSGLDKVFGDVGSPTRPDPAPPKPPPAALGPPPMPTHPEAAAPPDWDKATWWERFLDGINPRSTWYAINGYHRVKIGGKWYWVTYQSASNCIDKWKEDAEKIPFNPVPSDAIADAAKGDLMAAALKAARDIAVGKIFKVGDKYFKKVANGEVRAVSKEAGEAAEGVGKHADDVGKGTAKGPKAPKGKLRDRMGEPPKGMKKPEAHHDLPQADRFKSHWEREGLDINDPAHGRWVEGGPVGDHQKWSNEFNKEWDTFFKEHPEATREQILGKMNDLRSDPRFQ
jgi:RHS repeat-associated protein